ncbi:hypothetical protein QIW_1004 [Clostridioides difficile DA00134]|nr:hypothetical protein QIW_1004 [Clostridioides difficile DA00134]
MVVNKLFKSLLRGFFILKKMKGDIKNGLVKRTTGRNKNRG